MKATNIPTLQPVPFATNAASTDKRAIPATQPVGSPGAASYDIGFPPETLVPIASGGTPPFGQDFNGLFFDVTNELRWAQAGGTYVYNSAFATAIGGYPAGAVLKSASTSVLWISTVDDNTTDPDSSGATGWIAFRSNSGVAALAVVSGDITPTKVQLGASLISITGNAAGLTSTLRLPLVAGASYLVNNATTGSGSTLNVQGATGSGVTVAQGQAAVVFSDGTNYYTAGSSGAGVYLPINGTAVAATKLATARAFNLTGVITAAAQNFDGTSNVTLTTAIADGTLTIAKTSGLQTALDGKLGLGGGTLSGTLAINANGNQLVLNKSASGQVSNVASQTGGSYRWVLQMGDNVAESGGNAGSNLAIQRYSDTGAFIDSPLTIIRSSGIAQFSQAPFFQAGIRVSAGATAAANGQGAYIGWNKNTPSTNGETDFINHKGGGTGGFAWWNTDGTTYTLLGELLPGGVLRAVNTGATPSTPNLFALRGDGPYGGGLYLNDSGGSASWGTYCVSGSLVWSSGAINGGALAQRMLLSSSGNLTVTGTGNFQGSDIRFKRDIKRSVARPIHRGLHIHDYKMIASGEAGRGILAQDLLRRAKEYVSKVNIGTKEKPEERLTVNYAGTALEIAMWAANEVDRARSRARLERWVLAGLAIAVLLVKAL